jgi:Cellulase (glycosyl hydrolase family 5)
MLVGAADDIGKQADYADAKAKMDEFSLAGFDAIRIAQTWQTGQTKLSGSAGVRLDNAVGAAQFTGLRVILSIYPEGSRFTPLTDTDRADFATYAAAIAKRYPLVHDFIIGNEPNLNRFWMPQFGPNGEDVAAPAYEQLLATTYDALKAVRPHATVYGVALSPRGVDKPFTGRDTHSPTAFITDLGAAYRGSGRAVPIMDAFALHPYPENSSIGPDFPHPNSTSIGLADYDKLVALLGAAFDGTAQRGSTLPILYDEFGIETQVPPSKAGFYAGAEPATTHPVDEATQARMYEQAIAMAFCQKTVLGLLLFHVEDEAALPAWQSGLFYADGTPKTSLYPVRGSAFAVHRGIAATCLGMQLTPKLTLVPGVPAKRSLPVKLTCSLDCSYTIRLDAGGLLTGTAIGSTPKTVLFHGHFASGRHIVSGTATAAMNAGPPGSARVSFTLKAPS